MTVVSELPPVGTVPPKRLPSTALRTAAAYSSGVAAYGRSVLERRLMPWELSAELREWAAEVISSGRPEWSTPHQIVRETPLSRLRDFTRPEDVDAAVVPTLLLPPQAGHDSCVVDYSPTQSQVRTVLASGLVRTWSLDWKGATRATKNASIQDYLEEIRQAVDLLGGRVNLIGDCQGGWLSTIYAALRPEHVNSLTIAGAPIDFHAGDPAIRRWMRRMTPTGRLTVYQAVVAMNGGVMPGEVMLAGFKAMAPDGEVRRQLQLLVDLDDPVARARYVEFAAWFEWTQDVSGAFYLWIVENLFARNALLSGELTIGGERVDVGRITCPVALLAGATDHITPSPQVWALAEHVGTPKDQITRRLSSGGHLGLFMGTEALRDHWPVLLADVARISEVTRQ